MKKIDGLALSSNPSEQVGLLLGIAHASYVNECLQKGLTLDAIENNKSKYNCVVELSDNGNYELLASEENALYIPSNYQSLLIDVEI